MWEKFALIHESLLSISLFQESISPLISSCGKMLENPEFVFCTVLRNSIQGMNFAKGGHQQKTAENNRAF